MILLEDIKKESIEFVRHRCQDIFVNKFTILEFLA